MPKIESGERQDRLCEWAIEGLKHDQVTRFLDFCSSEGLEKTDFISYTQFIVLKKKFES